MTRSFDASDDAAESSGETVEGADIVSPAFSIAIDAGTYVAEDAPEPVPGDLNCGPPTSTDTQSEAGETGNHGDLAGQEAEKFVEDTFRALFTDAVGFGAHALGLGPVFQAARLTCKILQWEQVGEGDRGITVDVPIPLGGGFAVDLSVHLNTAPLAGEPLITAYCGPSDGAPVGVLAIGGLTVEPGDRYPRTGDSSAPNVQRQSPAASAPLPATNPADVSSDVATLQRDISEVVVPKLRTRLRRREGDVVVAVAYASGVAIVMWLVLDDATPQPSRVAIKPGEVGGSRIYLRTRR